MAKNPKSSAPASSQTVHHIYSSILLVAYLIIGFVPNWGAVDQIAPQWLYLNSVSVLSSLYIFRNHKYFAESIGSLFKTKFSWLYAGFIVWASASYFYAINPTEVLVNLARVVGTAIAFFNLFVLLQKIPNKIQAHCFRSHGRACHRDVYGPRSFVGPIKTGRQCL